MNKHLHIITLNIPDPPDYGGMIDIFYRIESLSNLGVRIHLHCFAYGRPHSKLLESICETVNYYPRSYDVLSFFSILPYIVASRKSKILLNNLKRDNYPILFDGLHTTYYLNHPALSKRIKMVRAHNIEHQYYQDSAGSESNLFKKILFYFEAIKLDRYEKIIKSADFILAISSNDHQYFENKYQHSVLILPFHPFNELICLQGSGEYAIFHGDLSVNENAIAAESLIINVFSKIKFKFIIAGKDPSNRLKKTAKPFSNISFAINPDKEEMMKLIRNAQIQVLHAGSSNGFKIKLIFALYAGRHCLVNSLIIKGTQAGTLCSVANSNEEIIERINSLMKKEFTIQMIEERRKVLSQIFSVSDDSKKIIDLI
jgi:hypothetical protein